MIVHMRTEDSQWIGKWIVIMKMVETEEMVNILHMAENEVEDTLNLNLKMTNKKRDTAHL